jgi:diguanylate cyclase (GGDEF)-like protein
MQHDDTGIEEQLRLEELARYDVLDTPPEEAFDRITRLVRQIFNCSMSTVTLIDGHRQWFKSRQGMADAETPRMPALCHFAIRQNEPLIVPDTLVDGRFSQNPFVVGDPHIRFYAGVQLRGPDGHAIGTLCAMDDKPRAFGDAETGMLKDLANIVMNELELRTLAMKDSLTGALSRRAFREEAKRAIALATRHKHELSCVMFDLDHFKSINDTHGHAIGDKVLIACIEVCRRELREADIVGRIGGEEFAVLLHHAGGEAAMQVADKLRAAFTNIFVQGDNAPVRISASFGICTFDPDADIDELLKRADAALYAAKAAGRNVCRIWEQAPRVQPSTRRRVFKAGQITFNGGHSTIACTVRLLSDSGASLDVSSSAGVPEVFKLQVTADALFRLCRIETKSERSLEVAFA